MSAAIDTRPALTDLASAAIREHALVQQAEQSALIHAICAGEALLDAREQVERGRWTAWLEDLGIPTTTAYTYMRVAYNREKVAAAGVEFIRDAYALTASLPYAMATPKELKAEARDLREAGLSLDQIAGALGASKSGVWEWVDPGAKQRNRDCAKRRNARRAAERKALERQERDRAARHAGGSIAEAYSLIRKTTQQLERAHGSERDTDAKRALSLAITLAYKCEDQVVKAIGTHA